MRSADFTLTHSGPLSRPETEQGLKKDTQLSLCISQLVKTSKITDAAFFFSPYFVLEGSLKVLSVAIKGKVYRD